MDLATGQRTVLASDGAGPEQELEGPQSLLVDEAGDRVLVGTVSGLVAVDLDSGERTRLTSDVGYINWLAADPACDRVLFTGGGAALTTPYAIDDAGKVGIVLDQPQCPVPAGTSLETPAYDPGSGRLLAWQYSLPGFVTIDTRTGACAVQVTVTPELENIPASGGAVVVDPVTGVLLGFSGGFEAIDPVTGERVLLSR